MTSIGKQIVYLRKSDKVSQKDLAAQLKISPTRLNYWEKDKRTPPNEYIHKIAVFFQVPATFVRGENPFADWDVFVENREIVLVRLWSLLFENPSFLKFSISQSDFLRSDDKKIIAISDALFDSISITRVGEAPNELEIQIQWKKELLNRELSPNEPVPDQDDEIYRAILTRPSLNRIFRTLASLDDESLSNLPIPTSFSQQKSSPIAVTGEHKEMIEKYNQLDGFGKSAVRSIIDIEAARMEAQQTQQEQFEDMKRNKVIRLFCYAQPVSAGAGARLDDEDGDMLEVVMNMETARADFCVKVTGHSMEPLSSW